MSTVEKVLSNIHNYFVVAEYDGNYTIENHVLSDVSDKLITGQYYKIEGSILNDGVYKYGTDQLINETFTGKVLALAIPHSLVTLIAEIDAWITKYGNGPYQSESFGGYSYTKGYSNKGTGGWEDAFKSQLMEWRKIA